MGTPTTITPPTDEKPPTGPQAVAAAAVQDPDAAPKSSRHPSALDPATQASATAWFMSEDVEESAGAIVPINVASIGKPEKIVDFKVQVLDRERIRALRKQAESKNEKGDMEVNDMEANLLITVEGLIDPDLSDSNVRTVRGQYYADPGDALRARFAHKPGLIDQLATAISKTSGYDDSDVKEIRAAGN